MGAGAPLDKHVVYYGERSGAMMNTADNKSPPAGYRAFLPATGKAGFQRQFMVARAVAGNMLACA